MMSFPRCEMGIFDFFKQYSSRRSISSTTETIDISSDTNQNTTDAIKVLSPSSLDSAISTISRSSIDESVVEIDPVESESLGSIQNYHVIRELGRGATAVVQLGKQKDGDQLVALKVFKTSLLKKMREIKRVGRKMVISTALDKVQVEIAIMKKLHHPNLLNLLEVFDDDTETLVLMLEYAPKGQIMHWNPQEHVYHHVFEETEVREIVCQLLLGLEYLHKHHICHRDLKPENILVGENGVYKIADFGVAHFFEESTDNQSEAQQKNGYVTSTAGTYAFMAPETLKGRAYCAYNADIWALGITIYALAFGTIPYYHSDVHELFEMIETQPLPSFQNNTSEEFADFLSHLLEKDPSKRYKISECKSHPWVVEGMGDKEKQLFLHPTDEQVSVNAEEVAKAVTRVTSFNVVLRMKMGANKWKRKAMSSMEAKKKAAATADTEGDTRQTSMEDNNQQEE